MGKAQSAINGEILEAYSQAFYVNRHEKTVHSANTILSIALERIPPVHSAVDLGCGVGTWLSVLHERGVKDIQGLDGGWVDQNLLAIPRENFKQIDLSTATIELPRKYDLAISLEVAEHLPADRAKAFVTSLTTLSDHVLFSAAIPFQGGVNHVNEQWQHYWVALFAGMDYVVQDFIRPRIWDDKQIPYWYRQNVFLFTKRQALQGTSGASSSVAAPSMALDLVHPDLYISKTNSQLGVKSSFRLFCRSVNAYIGRKFG